MTCYGQEDLLKEIKAEAIIVEIVNLVIVYEDSPKECFDKICELLIEKKYMREVKRYERNT